MVDAKEDLSNPYRWRQWPVLGSTQVTFSATIKRQPLKILSHRSPSNPHDADSGHKWKKMNVMQLLLAANSGWDIKAALCHAWEFILSTSACTKWSYAYARRNKVRYIGLPQKNIPPWLIVSWGQHGAHLCPVGPRRAPSKPHEPCYLGRFLHFP